jgi:hypothetical protein
MKCISCKHNGSIFCLAGHKKDTGCRYYETIKLYLCGKITGDDNYRDKFLEAENGLYEAGFYPVNPAACIPAGTDWKGAMRKAVSLMLSCDGVALLPDWKESKGAKIEARLARELGLEVRPRKDW